MKKLNLIVSVLAISGFLVGCDSGEKSGHGHDHGDSQAKKESGEGDDHDHGEEVELGTFDIGGISVEAAQAHGEVKAGEEGHLVIKLPYNDKGETVVRVWIGGEDRTLSSVGKGEYAPSHDDYDIHTMAPDPLPEGAKWWLEIEKPDGTKAVGSIPFLEHLNKQG